MAAGIEGNKQAPRTLATFYSGIPKALKLEFPDYEQYATPGPQPGPAPNLKAEVLPTLSEIRPQKAIIPHTNIFRSLTRPEPWGGTWQQMSLPGWPIKELRNNDAVTYLSLELDTEESGIKLDRKISLFDKSVLNAALNLFEAGNDIFTVRQLCSWMKGAKNSNSGIDEAAIERVEQSIKKQQRTIAKINATETFKQKGITEYDGELETYLLPIEKLKVWGKGKRSNEKVEAYAFIKEPPVLTHARATRQIYTAPAEALQTGKISATGSVTILRDYLMERIEAARGGKLSRKILYATVYEEMEIIEPFAYNYSDQTNEATGETIPAELAYKRELQQYHKKTAKVRKNVKGLLDNWAEQGYIKGYTESKKGKTLEGVTISFGQEKKKPKKGK
jgi:cell division protein FtsB